MQHLNYGRYLEAKRAVDDRALNREVYEKFTQILGGNGARLEILEIGAGTAAMLRRFLLPEKTDFPANVTTVEYTLLDIKREVLLVAKDLLLGNFPSFSAASSSMKHENPNIDTGNMDMDMDMDIRPITLVKGGKKIYVNFVLQDARSYLSRSLPGFDAVIACSFMDLMGDLGEFFDILTSALTSTSLRAVYLAVNFCGETRFNPQFIAQSRVDSFHENMGTFQPGNLPRSTSGNHLCRLLQLRGYKILAEGPSDWKVTPPYVDDERYFLKCILSFIRESTTANGNGNDDDDDTVEKGLQLIADEKVAYFASNLDICATL